MNKESIEAIIFDLGGTLIEYAGPFASWPELETPGFAAAHRYLEQSGIPMPELERFRSTGFDLLPQRWRQATSGARNLTVLSLLTEVLAHLALEASPDSVLKGAAKAYESAVRANASPIPYGRELLKQLKSSGYKLGLISNTMFRGQAHLSDLEKYKLDGFFDTMLFSADVNKWKPGAAPFTHILEELAVAPQAAVFIGDDPRVDVLGGRQAGLVTVHFQSSQRFTSLAGVVPDATIRSLQEIPHLLHRLNGHWGHATLSSR